MGLPVLASIGDDDDQPFHEHDWPASADDWDALVGCRTCGLRLLTGVLEPSQGSGHPLARAPALQALSDAGCSLGHGPR